MALNLSTLTSPATSGDVLAEALTTADFLEPCPVLKNLSRGSNKGGDAKQDVALNQPKALPLIDGDGYLYVSGVTGNYASIPHDSSLNLTNQLELVARVKYRSYTGSDAQTIIAKWAQGDFNFRFSTQGKLEIFHKDSSNTTHGIASFEAVSANNISDGDTIWVKATIDATTTTASFNFYSSKDNVKNESDVSWTALGATKTTSTAGGIFSAFNSVVFGAVSTAGNDDLATGAVLKANYKAAIGGTPVLDVDFTATNIRHGDTKFKCATGQVVTINQSGNDPATIIKKPVLRFANKSDNSTNISLSGLLNQVITDGYMFAAFSVLGDGGESFGRIFGLNATGGGDNNAGGVAFRRNGTTTGLMLRYNAANITTHSDLFDDERGDYLLDIKVSNGSQQSKVNNADADNGVGSIAGSLSAEEFSVAVYTNGINNNAAFDLEYLALFPATITDAQADSVRNYINNRNNVFDLKDGFGYYFYDAQNAPVGNITDVDTWSGRIVGSDNGDSASIVAQQATANDQPVGDGYVVTFADNTDHLDIPSTTQAGWQIVGTSLGTFAYRVNNTAVTELNLLGNAGSTSHRKAGQSYGMILLPDSATGGDIEAARKLLIDRGAADAPTGIISNYFRNRQDIVSFGLINTSTVSDLGSAWYYCTNITSFPLIDTSTVTGFSYAWGNNQSLTSFPLLNTSAGSAFINTWYNCVSLNNFPALNMSNGTNFSGAWQNCSALTSFPAGAKLGTEAASVNFINAWRSSGLTSFSTPLRTGTSFTSAWQSCSNLESFNSDFTSATNVQNAFLNCSNLVDFASGTFDVIGTPGNSCFLNTWSGCAALSANSVENILVSINTSGKSAPSTNPQITIDYNTATGSLSAATNAAVTSLKSKGWSIIVNNVTL